jgi:hypothetical protein
MSAEPLQHETDTTPSKENAMADTSTPQNALGAQTASCAQTVARIRELNERLVEFAMAEGSRSFDAYERALTTLVELTEMPGATPLGWLAALAQTHADFIRDKTTAHTLSVRLLLG